MHRGSLKNFALRGCMKDIVLKGRFNMFWVLGLLEKLCTHGWLRDQSYGKNFVHGDIKR